MSRIPKDEVAEVHERSGFYCEAGGLPISGNGELHHRKNRGSGGKGNVDVASNLLHVHSKCHAAIHRNPHRSYALGHMVHLLSDPADVPVKVLPGLCVMTGAVQQPH